MLSLLPIEKIESVSKQLYSERDFVVSVVGKGIEESELRKF